MAKKFKNLQFFKDFFESLGPNRPYYSFKEKITVIALRRQFQQKTWPKMSTFDDFLK
jgi:hypothetical protein